ncbi:MAG: hypothetical protein ACHQFW_00390 [Chitinophagales bacterium]
MTSLNSNWVTEGLLDLEYKKYLLLAYLQSINKQFDEKKIYPFLPDLIAQYNNLIAIKQNKKIADEILPKKISKLDLEQFKIEYEHIMHDNEHLDVILKIVNYAIPRIEAHIDIAKEIYFYADNELEIEPVGIVPIYTNEGYLIFRTNNYSSTHVFFYELSIIENHFEKHRGIKTMFVDSYPNKLYNYNEAIKSDLIKKNTNIPNPATYAINYNIIYPFQETIFPLAKKKFVRYLDNSNRTSGNV